MNLENLRPWFFWVLLCDFLGFAAGTAYVIYQYGALGWIPVAFGNPVGILVTVDLFIALSMVLGWVYVDARGRGISPWPYIGLTLATGSVGTLLYLLIRERPGAPAYARKASAVTGA